MGKITQLVILLVGLLLGLLSGCANPIPPKGGPKDETPPQIDSTKSFPNFQTNFEKQRIEITFDEWIKLDNAITQVVISPPLEKRETITLKGKSILIEFDEEELLKENVTYTINFGEAIKDITESNPLSNYRYVFATGSYIDSLELRGQVTDAYTEEVLDGVTVILYENLEDSVIYNEKPFYFTKTDKAGNFHLENLKSGTFKAIAILDGDQNKKYSGPQEKIGFISGPVTIPDTSLAIVSFKLFEPKPPLKLQSHSANAHFFKLVFNGAPDRVAISTNQNQDFTWTRQQTNDTILGWYQNATFPLEMVLTDSLLIQDTLKINQDTAWQSALVMRYSGKKRYTDLFFKDSIMSRFNQPIMTIDTTRILLEDSTGQLVDFGIRLLEQNKLILTHPFKQQAVYTLKYLPGSVSGIVSELLDTIIIPISTLDIESFGSVIVSLDNLDSTQTYLTRLMAKDQILFEKTLSNTVNSNYKIEGLRPGGYVLQVIEDQNGNGRWDTGNYLKGLFPERIVNNKIENLRANWEMNVTFTWKRI